MALKDLQQAAKMIGELAAYFGIDQELMTLFIAKESTRNTANAKAKQAIAKGKAKKSKKK